MFLAEEIYIVERKQVDDTEWNEIIVDSGYEGKRRCDLIHK